MNEEIKAKETQEAALSDEELGGVTGGMNGPNIQTILLPCSTCNTVTWHETYLKVGVYKCKVCGTVRVGVK